MESIPGVVDCPSEWVGDVALLLKSDKGVVKHIAGVAVDEKSIVG